MARRTRQEKYPETAYFHYLNINPKHRITGDCAVRAISLATDKSYKDVVLDMAAIQIETGYDPTCDKGIEKLLTQYGWVKHKMPKHDDNTRFTGTEFLQAVNESNNSSNIILNIGTHHMSCIKDHERKFKIWDIWDCSAGKVGNYWTKW